MGRTIVWSPPKLRGQVIRYLELFWMAGRTALPDNAGMLLAILGKVLGYRRDGTFAGWGPCQEGGVGNLHLVDSERIVERIHGNLMTRRDEPFRH